MVKAKHQKSKSKSTKQPHIKKHGKQGDISDIRAQLDAFGLKIIQVTADGNCFFRALADQLDGSEEEHEKYRSMVVQYILKNREMFEPFIEDEVPFDEYCQSMEKDGTWAGHMELQAASLVTHSNICIHRISSPRWYIQNFDNREARMVHLSYHDGEHYNSVRLKEDTCTGPARPIIIKADADLSATSRQAKVAVTKSKGGAGKNFIHVESIKLVMAGGGCEDAKKVEQVLQQVEGDVDAAIEFLIAEEGNKEYLVESDKLPCPADTSHGNGRSSITDERKKKKKKEKKTKNRGDEEQHRNEGRRREEQELRDIPSLSIVCFWRSSSTRDRRVRVSDRSSISSTPQSVRVSVVCVFLPFQVTTKMETMSNTRKNSKTIHPHQNHLVIRKELMMIKVHRRMRRKSQETRFAHVVQRRNTRLVVDPFRGDPLLNL